VVAANPYALMYASLARALSGARAPLFIIYHSTRWPGLKQQAQLLATGRVCGWRIAPCVRCGVEHHVITYARGPQSARDDHM